MNRSRLIRYYSEATQDYEAWSPHFHMHFGYYRWGINPLNLESMLEEMTRQVLARLGVRLGQDVRLADLGCGMGASSRLAARDRPGLRLDAVTLVGSQVREASVLAARRGLEGQVRFVQADYTAAPIADGSYDGVFAIESACHASGLDKRSFVSEAGRVLRNGHMLVVADGFVKRRPPERSPLGWC